MSGIYIHIPFCKQACHYCDFHFSTSLKQKDKMVLSIIKEIELRKDYLSDHHLDSIYFGGGTPSLLDKVDISMIFKALGQYYTWDENCEITLEANPDDLSIEKLKILGESPINRLSIGVQSFHQHDLKYMNRAHNQNEALASINNAKQYGFDNITIDLIYGSPTTTDEQWKKNLDIAFNLGINHISSYALTVEEGTALHHFIATGKSKEVDDERALKQFEILTKMMKNHGYLHYETSNFALPNHLAVHNSNYWKREPYIGIGPSAHSFNGTDERSWNIANNAKYIKAIAGGNLDHHVEKLSISDQYNEYILTNLRTHWGISAKVIEHQYPDLLLQFNKATNHQLKLGNIIAIDEKTYILTQQGKFVADRISSDYFHIN